MDDESPLTPAQEADQKTHFIQTAADTQGELLEIDAYYEAHSEPPTAHFHPNQHEYFEVLDGTLTVIVNGKRHVYDAGERFDIPPGTPHSMWNDHDEEAHINWQIRPALKSQQFFENVWGLERDGKSIAKDMAQAAVILLAYRREFRLTRPSPLVQMTLFPILALLGRLMGYKASYGRYSPSK